MTPVATRLCCANCPPRAKMDGKQMTGTELWSGCTASFGMEWQTPLARSIGVSRRTVVRWAAGDPIPAKMAALIRAILAIRAGRDPAPVLIENL